MIEAQAPLVLIEGLTKKFTLPHAGREVIVFEALDLAIRKGEFVSLVGPSGCGKSTLLNIVAGIERSDGGRVSLGSGGGTAALRMGYVFQKPRLLDWLSVEDNLGFVLEAAGVPRREWRARVSRYLRLVGLDGQQRNYPLNLSGGMQQRVGIARALVIEPDLLLMDEPFSNLDEITARRLRLDLMRIHDESKVTTLFVTHDLREAVFLSDTIHMMGRNPGRIFRSLDVGLPRPRGYEDEAVFSLERSLVLELLREVERSDAERPQ